MRKFTSLMLLLISTAILTIIIVGGNEIKAAMAILQLGTLGFIVSMLHIKSKE